MFARLSAFALAIIGLASLRAQFDSLTQAQGLGPKLWLMAAFFTIWTNVVLVVHLLAITKGWQIAASRAAGMLVSILTVAIVYHALLARLWAPQGLAWWADQGLHTAMPLGYLVWWLGFAPKDLSLADVPEWLLLPLIYGIYAVIRGATTGFWPYPFLNADVLGWPRVGLNIGLLLIAFAALSLCVLALARRFQSAKPA